MADVKWIKITTDMFDDEKIDFIISLPEADALIVIWIRLITLAGKCNAGGYIFLTESIPYTEEMLAHKFRKPLNVVKFALETFCKLKMIEVTEVGILLLNFEKHQNIEGLEKIREQTRKRVNDCRERKRGGLLGSGVEECNATCNATVTQCNATDIDKELDIDKDIKTFDDFWLAYPKKAGKEQAKKYWKKLMTQKWTPEQLIQCAVNYSSLVKKEGRENKYIKQADGFLNPDKKMFADYIGESEEQKPSILGMSVDDQLKEFY